MGVIGDLLDKAHGDEKGNLSKEDQARYNKALMEDLQQNGINDENIFYLISGIKFGTMNTLIQWNRAFSAEDQTDNVEKILNSHKAQSMDNQSKLRLLLSLLINELNEKEVNDTSVGDVLYCLDDASYKKDGGRLTDIGRIFKNCFLADLRSDTKLPHMAKYNFTPDYEVRILGFFDEAISKIEPKGDQEIDKRNLLRRWIEKEHQVLDKAEKSQQPQNDNSKQGNEKETNKKSDNEKNDVINEEKIEIKSTLGKKLFDLAKVMDTLDDSFRETEKKLKEKEREISRLKTNLDKLQDLYQASIDENTVLKERISEVQSRNDVLEKENVELNDRVNRQISVIDVYDQDKANSRNELLNQIAASLKKIYTDYKVAEDMEMTIELGENMRDSLDDVFRKMKKLGIDIEGR